MSLAGRKQKITPSYLFSIFQRYRSPARGATLKFQALDASFTDPVQSETVYTSGGEKDFQRRKACTEQEPQLCLHSKFLLLLMLRHMTQVSSCHAVNAGSSHAERADVGSAGHTSPPARLAGGAISQQTHACRYMVGMHVYSH